MHCLLPSFLIFVHEYVLVCLSDQRSYIYFVMVGGEKQSLTPKEIIHHKFGVNASYRIEQVHVSSQSTCLYRCHLQLPDFSVVSNVFKRKKDAELSAAELALEKVCFWYLPPLFCIYIFVFLTSFNVAARHSPSG